MNKTKTMKLELKHLAPYLPYGLKVKGEKHIWELNSISVDYRIGYLKRQWGNRRTDSEMWLLDYNHWHNLEQKNNPNKFKPILRPLSDLTKEVDWGNRKTCVLDIWFEIDDAARHDWEVFKKLPDYWESVIKNIELNGFNRMDWGFLNILFEWHFDVFGLIDKGLAININEL